MLSRTTETFQRRHFGQMRDPIGTLAPEKSIPGPIFDMKRAGFWRASVVDLRSEEVSTSTPTLRQPAVPVCRLLRRRFGLVARCRCGF